MIISICPVCHNSDGQHDRCCSLNPLRFKDMVAEDSETLHPYIYKQLKKFNSKQNWGTTNGS